MLLLYDLTYFEVKIRRFDPSATGLVHQYMNKARNVVLIDTCLLQSKSNHTINHTWSHEQYIQQCVVNSLQMNINMSVTIGADEATHLGTRR